MKNSKRPDGKNFTVLNLILTIALIFSVIFVIYSSNKNSGKTAMEASKEKLISQNLTTENTEEARKAELVGKDKEETTFDKPIDVVWEGEIMAVFMSGQSYGIKKIPEDKDFPYFYAGINSDAFPEHVVLEGNVEVTGKWTGITCAYQNTVFKRCVPEVELQKIVRNYPIKDWSEPYAFSVGDFSGDKIPDILEETFTGGAHCCWKYRAFIKEEKGVKALNLDERDHGLLSKDVNDDGIYELIGSDSTFNYWKTAYATSPAPEVILSYDKESSSFKLNLDLMKKPAPTQEDFSKKIALIESDEDGAINSEIVGVSPILWGYMLDLIYTSNEKLAWEFLDQAWSNSEKEKINFKKEFQNQLKKSPYFKEIEKLKLVNIQP